MSSDPTPSVPAVGQRWRYKPNRGTGSFVVVRVAGSRVTLRDYFGKTKTIGARTLRGDYEQVLR